MKIELFKLGESPYFIQIKVNEYLAGDTVIGEVTIQSGKLLIDRAELYFQLSDLNKLMNDLKNASDTLKGEFVFTNIGEDICVHFKVTQTGRIEITGHFQEFPSINNRMEFEFQLDQSYIPNAFCLYK